jgi:CheY-like chemotaxis protein
MSGFPHTVRFKEHAYMARKIMVVDDDTGLRIALQEILIDKGREVLAAKDGFEAIELASQGEIDLIFMDIRMPGMDGVETFLKIKEILPNCVAVMMTGHAVESLIERALSEGAKACLKKPVSIEEILEIVDETMPESTIARRIMVVDDDTDLRITLREILVDKGREVLAAKDGFQAIEFASEGNIDLIFMDIRMPGMDGVEAFLKIKKILPECIVVMMTGHAVESLIEQALSEGANTCLSKPVSIEGILEIVEETMPV